jgi:hypothetical protein
MKNNLHTVLGLVLFSFELYFIARGFQNEIRDTTNEQSLQNKKNKAVYYMIISPWRTKYYWGGVIQITLLLLIIVLQIM